MLFPTCFSLHAVIEWWSGAPGRVVGLIQPPGLAARGAETGRLSCQSAIGAGAGRANVAEDTVANFHTFRPAGFPCLVTGLGHGPLLPQIGRASCRERE